MQNFISNLAQDCAMPAVVRKDPVETGEVDPRLRQAWYSRTNIAMHIFQSMLLIVLLCWLMASPWVAAQTVSVTASVETDPVPGSGDAADDPTIWVHPTDPSQSTVIGTDKKTGGLVVYDLQGREIQHLNDGRMNNVDVRYNFPLGGTAVDIVAAGNRSNDSIAIYVVNKATRLLENVSAGTIDAGIDVYGSCMYQSATSDQYFSFVNSKSGEVAQWHLFDNGSGLVTGMMVRAFDVGSQTEGCVADDELGDFYIGEEAVGIWKYGAEPTDGNSRTSIDSTGLGGNLTADVEGLTIYYTSDSRGYLIASSQGADEFVIYERGGANAYVATFKITSSATIDGVSDTDGIDVLSTPLGSGFPSGVFVAQDGSNSGDRQNFKLVPWQSIATAVDPDLTIDLLWNPRGGARPPDRVVPLPLYYLLLE